MHRGLKGHFKTTWSSRKEKPFNLEENSFTCAFETDKPATTPHMEKIFLTGATGIIGRRVVEQLTGRGDLFNCLVRPGRETSGIPKELTVHGDILDANSLRAGMQGASHVIHLAALADWEHINSPKVRETIVEGTRNVLAAAKAAGIRRVLYVSSAAAINGTHQPQLLDESAQFTLPVKGYLYAHAKHEAENLCQTYQADGLPVVIVNPSETYDPGGHRPATSENLRRLASGPALVTRGGTGVVHAIDVAKGILATLLQGHPGQRYILSSENLSYARIGELVREACGRPTRFREVPNLLVQFLASLEKHLPLPLGLNPGLIPYATRYWFMDSRKARQHLGWRPQSAMQTVLETAKALCQEQGCGKTAASRSQA